MVLEDAVMLEEVIGHDITHTKSDRKIGRGAISKTLDRKS